MDRCLGGAARNAELSWVHTTAWNEQTQDGDCAYVKGRRDLTAEQRTAAKLCGYSASACDDDKDVEIEQRSWTDVSEEQRETLR